VDQAGEELLSQGSQQGDTASPQLTSTVVGVAAATTAVFTFLLLLLCYVAYRKRRLHLAAKRAAQAQSHAQDNALLFARSPKTWAWANARSMPHSSHTVHHPLHRVDELSSDLHAPVSAPFLPGHTGIQASFSAVRFHA
jgi:hypothetical protein